MEKFRISVRSLVEFLLHSGDIDGGKGGMADKAEEKSKEDKKDET